MDAPLLVPGLPGQVTSVDEIDVANRGFLLYRGAIYS